jgi:hypothetical protein
MNLLPPRSARSRRRSTSLGAIARRASLVAATLVAAACSDAAVTSPKSAIAPRDASARDLAPVGSLGVLILGSSVYGGMGSQEASAATALGFPVTLVTDAQWSSMTSGQFSQYRAIVIGDPYCGLSGATVATAAGNAHTWGSVANGNVFIIGSDPVLHNRNLVTQKGIAFATAAAGKTGAYITTSCFYHGTAPNTATPMLNGLSSLGTFTATGVPGCFNSAHIVATSPSLAGINDSYLSGWGCSVHNGFDHWPSDFDVLAIATTGGVYHATDGTVGTPYILARGEGLSIVSDIQLTPATASIDVNTAQTVTATVLANGAPVVGTTVTFTVVDGPDAGTTSTATTDGNGMATYTITRTSAGTDGIRATFVDALNRTQTSNRAAITWNVPADATPPVITPNISGTLGAGDWYVSNIGVTWTVVDNESPITSKTGCDATSVTTDGNNFTFTCTATSTGGTATKSISLKRDASAPLLDPVVTGTLGASGWYTSDIQVDWTHSDPTSGVDDHHDDPGNTDCLDHTVTADIATVTFTCKVTNGAGLSTTKSVTVKRDATKPVVTYSGNAGTYTVDQTVAITCSASDAMSGVASSTCANVGGDAYTFGLGAHTYSATATDRAGNTGSASTTFTVKVTGASLCALTRRFVSNNGVANSLCQKLDAADAAFGRGQPDTAHNVLAAYINEVQAQSGGKFLSAANASILMALAGAM